VVVVVMPPTRQHLAGMGEAVEHLVGEAFIVQFSIEQTLRSRSAARRDVVPGDAALLLPLQGRPAGKLRPVVGHDGLRLATEPDAAI
jgi:hypothetical protein